MRNRLLTILGVSLLIGIVFYFLGIKLTKADLAISAAAEPIICLGGALEGEHCASGFPITNSLIMTVIVDILLFLTIIFSARNMQLIPRGFQNFVEFMVEGFYNFAQSVDRKNVAKFFPLCASIFFFVLYSNYFALVPGVGSIGVCRGEHGAGGEGAAGGERVAAWATLASVPCCGEEGKVSAGGRARGAGLNVGVA